MFQDIIYGGIQYIADLHQKGKAYFHFVGLNIADMGNIDVYRIGDVFLGKHFLIPKFPDSLPDKGKI